MNIYYLVLAFAVIYFLLKQNAVENFAMRAPVGTPVCPACPKLTCPACPKVVCPVCATSPFDLPKTDVHLTSANINKGYAIMKSTRYDMNQTMMDLASDLRDPLTLKTLFNWLSDADKYYVGVSLLDQFVGQCQAYGGDKSMFLQYLSPRLYLLQYVSGVVSPNGAVLKTLPYVSTYLKPYFNM